MSRYKIETDANDVVTGASSVGNEGLVGTITDGILGPITMAPDEALSKSSVLVGTAAYATAGAVAGSMLGRSNQKKGVEPIAGFLF